MEPSVVLPLSADLPRALSPCLLPHLLCRLSQGPQYRGEAGLSHLRVSSEDLSQLISRMWQFSQYYLIIISIIEHSDSHRKKLIWDNFLPPLRLFLGYLGHRFEPNFASFPLHSQLIIITSPICRKVTSLRDGHANPPTDSLLRFLVESSSDEFPSCANCDRNEKSPMFFCNTCGKNFVVFHYR